MKSGPIDHASLELPWPMPAQPRTRRRRVVPQAKTAVRTGQLWLAIHLHELPLRALNLLATGEVAAVIASGLGARQQVVAANPAALRAGVVAGMRTSAACALTELMIMLRDERAEAGLLNGLALWAQQFTPQVSLEPQGLLLEIGGSLHLFGGITALLARLREDLAGQRCQARLAVAPLPAAAMLLARHGIDEPVATLDELLPLLGGLPVEGLGLPARTCQALHDIGVGTLRECLRLPRADLGRRCGASLLERLDTLTGRRDEPRASVPLPDVFSVDAQLPWGARNTALLLAAAEPLLVALQGYLRARCAVTELLEWTLIDDTRRRQSFALRLSQPQADSALMLRVLAEKLSTHTLTSPVIELRLRVEQVRLAVAGSATLFQAGKVAEQLRQPVLFTPQQEQARVAALVDRLTARLGMASVGGVSSCPEHRPEHASRWSCGLAAGRPECPPPLPPRPAWLLKTPLSLPAGEAGAPTGYRLLGEGERIESGWWDEQPVGRDYYRAQAPAGGCCWLFRDLRAQGQWFLHGWFE
ncbi:MAG: DNA polymerase Y family protein [Gammaproteobacteria bacterium]|nr:DNA polymerase Y family protein [Gammaproteobacteria bacterium]